MSTQSSRPTGGASNLRRLTEALFTLLLVLLLGTRGQLGQAGPLTWLPLTQAQVAGFDVAVGALMLLPALFGLCWLVLRLRERRPWRWGPLWFVTPLALLSLLALVSLGLNGLTAGSILALVALGLFWVIYLFALNERPALLVPLAIVVLLQGGVALAQFEIQRSLGLSWLGEMDLHRELPGYSIVWARDQRWLRAYGLTGHPNILAATLAMALVFLLPFSQRLRGWRLILLTFCLSVGALGLAASFSRTAWLAAVIAALSWALLELRRRRRSGAPLFARSGQLFSLAVPLLLVLVFLLLSHDLLLSRVSGVEDIYSEAKSISDRQRDAAVALTLIGERPWRGVGLGNFRPAARQIEAKAFIVHNIPLLLMSELGVIAGLLWLWLMLAGLWYGWRGPPIAFAAWLLPIVIAFFDATLWMTTSLRGAALLALLAAVVATQSNVEDFPP